MFPRIEHLDDFKQHIQGQDDIRIAQQPNGFYVVCYMIADEMTFFRENSPWARECRGLTFYPDGKIASRPLHKFFNVGECAETQFHELDFSQKNLVRLMNKRDGSMVHPVRTPEGIVFKSKKSFESDVAIAATKFAQGDAALMKFCSDMIDEGCTPIFEYTSPSARIVLHYEDTSIHLLHVRNNITGEYFSPEKLRSLEFSYDVKLVEEYDPEEFQTLIDGIPTLEQAEGFVFQFANGNMVKWKTPWYLNLHHAVTFVRERDIAVMVIEETVDDYKSFLSMTGANDSIAAVQEIEHKVAHDLNELQIQSEALFEEIKGLDRKEAALKIKDRPYFKFAMLLYAGKTPDYKAHFMSYILKEKYGLHQI